MLRLLILGLIVVAGMILGPMLLSGEQGLVLFQLAGYRISMSFTTFVILSVLVLLVLYTIFWLCRLLWKGGKQLRRRSAQHSLTRLYKAQAAFINGDFKKAQRLFLRNARYQIHPLQSYLLATQAALRHNDLIAARYYLDDAVNHCQTAQDKLNFAIVQLQYMVHNQEWANAAQQVEKLLNEQPRNPQLLRLADKIYFKMHNYQAIIDLLPQLQKADVYSEAQFIQFRNQAYQRRMLQLAQLPDKEKLLNWWQDQPRAIRQTAELQSAMERHLTQQGQLEAAQKIAAKLSKQLT